MNDREPNLDRPCEHIDFHAMVEVARLTDCEGGPVVGYSADITVFCVACDEAFRWIGCPYGLSPRHPTVGIDETHLLAPLRPASSDPDFGMGLPGISIRIRTEGVNDA
jgi:hypothetical protein